MINRSLTAFAALLCAQVAANATDWTSSTAAASSSLWPTSQAIDGNFNSSWSSNTHSAAAASEYFAFWFPGNQFNSVNYVKLRPRYNNGKAIGFPTSFTIYYSNGSSWVKSCDLTNFPIATRGDDLILPLPAKVSANGILIQANTLGLDDVGNYVFQLAESHAGYEAAFDTKFQFSRNDAALSGQNEIQNAGSGNFDPNKISEWHNDVRWPLIAAKSGTTRNIYNPTIVQNGTSNWNVYFGGWDGESVTQDQAHDEISVTVSPDDFLTFNPHALMIGHGDFYHLCNPSAIKNSANSWTMTSTALMSNGKNRPMIATATNGIDWTPSTGKTSSLININNYPNWSASDINGGNAIYNDGAGGLHLFFVDFANTANIGTHHAISYDGGKNFDYNSAAQPSEQRIVNDLKAFNYNGSKAYILLTHTNGADINLTWSSSLYWFPAHQVTLTHKDNSDASIVSGGMVTNGSRLYGVLYGALTDWNHPDAKIFGRWLQKKVIFKNAYVQWGDIEEAYGPDRVRLYMNTSIETGNFYVYDTDGKTLLYTSPRVTMRSGDIWKILSI